MSTTTHTTPRIYAACLAAYNSGRLHGRWIDATQGVDHIRDEIAAMLAASPEPGAEEFAIHDHEGLGQIGEYESLDRIAAIGEAVAEAGDDAAALLAWLDGEPGRDPGEFADVYRGEWDSLADYVRDYWDNVGHDEEKASGGQHWHPARYVDWDAMARDLEMSGDVETHNAPGGVYVFDNN
jgi:antirestriction protein